jgi:hypothetical protein
VKEDEYGFIYLFQDRTLEPVEIILSRGKEGEEE